MMQPLVRLQGIAKNFGGVEALKGVTLGIEGGSVHAIVGQNGAGKSTLMNILAGVIADYNGRIVLDGLPVRPLRVRDAEALGIAMIHQELNLVPDLTVEENIMLGREPSGLGFIKAKELSKMAEEALKTVGVDVDPGMPVRRLRMGEKQLAEIARALQRQARILIMDEPTSALSEAEVKNLFAIIRRLADSGVTVIYISHKMDEVFGIAERISVLRDGRLLATLNTADTSPEQVIRLMVGESVRDSSEGQRQGVGRRFLLVDGLGLRFRGRWLLRELSFEVNEGEIFGLAGMLGAGKTETLLAIYGHYGGLHEGSLSLAGERLLVRSPAEAIAAGIAMVNEDRQADGLFADMNVTGNITISVLQRLAAAFFVQRRKERRSAEAIGEALSLQAPSMEAPVTTLSGGNQQKALLGRCLLQRPRLLLLDEPTRGIDVGAKAQIYGLIRSLADGGVTVLTASSEAEELTKLCDRVAVLREGRLAKVLERGEVSEEAIVYHSTVGLGRRVSA
jgi:ribose transport system ATP-binding protein